MPWTKTDEALSRLRCNAWRWSAAEKRSVRVDEDVAVVEAELAALRELEDAVRGMYRHGTDLRNGTHAGFVHAALAKLDALRGK